MKKFFVIILLLLFSISALEHTFAGSGNLPGFGYFPSKLEIVFAGCTAAVYDGDIGDYSAADAACAGKYSGSHVCQAAEILWLINQKKALPDEGECWINDGAPDYTANANDCIGWSSDELHSYGRYWDFAAQQGWLRGCINSLPFACCK